MTRWWTKLSRVIAGSDGHGLRRTYKEAAYSFKRPIWSPTTVLLSVSRNRRAEANNPAYTRDSRRRYTDRLLFTYTSGLSDKLCVKTKINIYYTMGVTFKYKISALNLFLFMSKIFLHHDWISLVQNVILRPIIFYTSTVETEALIFLTCGNPVGIHYC